MRVVPEGKNVGGFVGYAMVAAAATLWGCWALFLRPAGLPGAVSAFVVFCVMASPLPLSWRGWAGGGDRGAFRALVALGLFDAANVGLYFEALRRGPVAVAVLTHYLAPLLVVLSAPWVAGERRSRRAWVAAPLSLGGLLLLLGAPGGAGFPLATAALGAGSALFYAGIVFASKRAGRAYSPLAVTALHAPLSGLALVVMARGQVLPAPGSRWGWAAAGAALCGVFANILFNTGLRRIPTQAASALTYLEPVTAAALGWAVFGERLSAWGVAGIVLVLACGAWVVSEPQPVPAPVSPAAVPESPPEASA